MQHMQALLCLICFLAFSHTVTAAATTANENSTNTTKQTTAANMPEFGSVHNPDQQFKIANQYINATDGFPRDPDIGFKWLKLAAAQFHPEALYALAQYYDLGMEEIDQDQDLRKAIKLYKEAGKRGITDAYFNLGILLFRPNTHVRDLTEARHWMEQAALRDDASAQFNLAQLYREKLGTVDADLEKARHWLQQAADNHYSKAQFTLATQYMEGELFPRDIQKAFKWYLRAAEQGDAAAQFNVGLMYSEGQGIEQDQKAAIQWYQKAANQEEPGALYNLGISYYFGNLLEQDRQKGQQLIEKAAHLENPAAQYLMGHFFDQGGEFFSRDSNKALTWYRASAEQGYLEAQYSLAVMLANGMGTDKNLIEAAFWLLLAAEQGQQHAINGRESIVKLLSNSELETVKKRVDLALSGNLQVATE